MDEHVDHNGERAEDRIALLRYLRLPSAVQSDAEKIGFLLRLVDHGIVVVR